MSNSFGIKVIACDKIFYSGRCTQLVLPLRDGSKAIQAHHENMVFSVEVGEIKITKEDGQWIGFYKIRQIVDSGFGESDCL